MRLAVVIPLLLPCVCLIACGGKSDPPVVTPADATQPAELAEPRTTPILDSELLALAREPGFEFYRGSDARLPFTSRGGGHGGYIRVRFNRIALSALGSDGKLPEGSAFPEGAVIVKELYADLSGPQAGQAIIRKSLAAPNATADWVWAEYDPSDAPLPGASAIAKGLSCVGCHSLTAETSPVPGDSGNRDLVRTFGLR